MNYSPLLNLSRRRAGPRIGFYGQRDKIRRKYEYVYHYIGYAL